MPLAQPLPDLRRHLQEILSEDLVSALNALKELLPEGSAKHNIVFVLRARLNNTNKERFRNTLSSEEYLRHVNTIIAECFDLLSDLEEEDFKEKGKMPSSGDPTDPPDQKQEGGNSLQADNTPKKLVQRRGSAQQETELDSSDGTKPQPPKFEGIEIVVEAEMLLAPGIDKYLRSRGEDFWRMGFRDGAIDLPLMFSRRSFSSV